MKNPPSAEKIKVFADLLDSDRDGVLKVDVIEKVRPPGGFWPVQPRPRRADLVSGLAAAWRRFLI